MVGSILPVLFELPLRLLPVLGPLLGVGLLAGVVFAVRVLVRLRSGPGG